MFQRQKNIFSVEYAKDNFFFVKKIFVWLRFRNYYFSTFLFIFRFYILSCIRFKKSFKIKSIVKQVYYNIRHCETIE